MSDWKNPACPWCGEDISDSPEEDFGGQPVVQTECGNCDGKVRVYTKLIIVRRAEPIEEAEP